MKRITKQQRVEIVREWMRALRSGTYHQIQGALVRVRGGGKPLGYCCLGVGCEVVKKKVPGLVRREKAYYTTEAGRYAADLPPEVRDALGLKFGNGRYVTQTLASHNDYDGYTFDQIADVIASRPDGLFDPELFPKRWTIETK